MEYHRTSKRSTCVPAGHVHCKNCDKSIIVPMSYAEGATELICYDCQQNSQHIKKESRNAVNDYHEELTGEKW